MQQQAYTSAQAICRQLLAQNPDDFNARHLLGVIKMQAGNPLGACKELRQAADLPVAPRFKAQALSNLSLALQQRERTAEALAAIEQALALEPEEQAFHLNRLNLLESLERWSAIAQAALDHPILNSLSDARYPLARAARKRGELDEALTRIQPLCDAEDVDPEIIGEWALLMILTGQEQGLLRQIEAFDSRRLQTLADYMAEEGEDSAALLIYRALLRMEPGHAGARHMIDAAAGHIEAGAPADYIRDLYDAHAERFEQQLVRRLGYRAPELLAEQLQSLLPTRLERVADLGCGSGLLGRALRQRFDIASLHGCDLSPGMLEQARRQGGYDRLDREELLAWLNHETELDLVGATDVLIYTGDLAPVMQAVARSLRPGGWFAFSVEASAQELQLGGSGRYRHGEHHVRCRAAAAGLEVHGCERFPLREEQGKMVSGLMVICRRPDDAER